MGARTIRTGIGTYRNADGRWAYGFLGDEVEVHEGDLERFDRLNPSAPAEEAGEVEVHEDDLEPKPTRSTRGSKKE